MAAESLEVQSCPKCGAQAPHLVDIDPGMRLILQQNGSSVGDLPNQVCAGCYGTLTNQVSQGVKLRLEQQAKEKNRHMAWKSRVNLIKHARQMMSQKSYPDAAVSYEKYIRIIEMSYDLKPGQLSASVFGNTSRSKEITVIATTFWDLLRIYDTMPQYRNRMQLAAQKLAEFLPYSPIYPDVIKRAQAFSSTAKNPEVVKDFLRRSKVGGGRCFIATAAFESEFHPVVIELRLFRDTTLTRSYLGRALISVYYSVSPHMARLLDKNPQLRPAAKAAIAQIHRLIKFLARPLV